jgi:hypothetical protein
LPPPGSRTLEARSDLVAHKAANEGEGVLFCERGAGRGVLAVTCNVRQGRHRYTSREVLLGAVEKTYDLGLERLGILTPP